MHTLAETFLLFLYLILFSTTIGLFGMGATYKLSVKKNNNLYGERFLVGGVCSAILSVAFGMILGISFDEWHLVGMLAFLIVGITLTCIIVGTMISYPFLLIGRENKFSWRELAVSASIQTVIPALLCALSVVVFYIGMFTGSASTDMGRVIVAITLVNVACIFAADMMLYQRFIDMSRTRTIVMSLTIMVIQFIALALFMITIDQLYKRMSGYTYGIY